MSAREPSRLAYCSPLSDDMMPDWVWVGEWDGSYFVSGGGCRDSGVARVDWSRYCSEACQRAHWLAGHKDECPCAH